jgi:hypothetical protein
MSCIENIKLLPHILSTNFMRKINKMNKYTILLPIREAHNQESILVIEALQQRLLKNCPEFLHGAKLKTQFAVEVTSFHAVLDIETISAITKQLYNLNDVFWTPLDCLSMQSLILSTNGKELCINVQPQEWDDAFEKFQENIFDVLKEFDITDFTEEVPFIKIFECEEQFEPDLAHQFIFKEHIDIDLLNEMQLVTEDKIISTEILRF